MKYHINILLIVTVFLLSTSCSDSKEEDKHIGSIKAKEEKMKKYTNKLIREKSPYLQQHAHNPVNWHPWGKEAFEKAKQENKPIFLSIGYSTCHWCHVMEHESFEDEEVAKLLNDAFICIKVDREERPDIDSIYMNACQTMTGSGGWPLTIIMTPDKKPFFAATYIPKESRFGRPGMMQMIPQIKTAWKNDKDKIIASADGITNHLKKVSSGGIGNLQKLNRQLVKSAYNQMSARFDSVNGGFSGAPKFPMPHSIIFLLQYWQKTGNPKALAMAEFTLRKMRRGGVYDQIGFGFHRYSTDEKWLLPHFEKMLYDNALLTIAYAEAYQITGEKVLGDTAKEIMTYITRDMTSPEGGFYSAEDADSEGEEGKYYVWSEAELQKRLTKTEFNLVDKFYNTDNNGNFHDEATGHKSTMNIFYLNKELTGDEKKQLEPIREKLFKIREKRIPPLKDTKILTDWNGLMIAAFAKSGRIFNDPEYTKTAIKAADFILEKMRNSQGDLMHRYKDGEIAVPGQLNDYAFMIFGLLELYEATFEVKYLQSALEFNVYILEHFQDKINGGFYQTSDSAEKLIYRPKSFYDGAIPSGNSVQMLNLLRISRITGKQEYEEKAEEIEKICVPLLERSPTGFTQMLSGIMFAEGPTFEITIAGKKESPETEKIFTAINKLYLPFSVIVFKPDISNPTIDKIAPYTSTQRTIDGQTTVYICKNYVCNQPLTEVKAIIETLKK